MGGGGEAGPGRGRGGRAREGGGGARPGKEGGGRAREGEGGGAGRPPARATGEKVTCTCTRQKVGKNVYILGKNVYFTDSKEKMGRNS